MAEVLAGQIALSTVAKLNDAVQMLHEAVRTSKKNDGIMREIATTIRHRAPIITMLLSERLHSDNQGIHKALCDALQLVRTEMDEARLVVYAWLLKGAVARLGSAAEMEQALKHVMDVLDRRLKDVDALMQADIRLRLQLGSMQPGTPHPTVQGVAGLHGERAQAVAQQWGRLLDESDPAQTLLTARYTLDMSSKRGAKLTGHQGVVNCVAWSPDGSKLATASGDYTAALWDAATGQRLHSLRGHTDWVRYVVWSPDGSQLATASDDYTAALWDAATGQRLRTLEGHKVHWVRCVAWSRAGSRVATASGDKTTAGQRLRTLQGDRVWCMAWSPDGSKLATASDEKTASVWDMTTEQLLRTLEGHTGTVRCVAWSPDSSQVATASGDNTAVLWCAATGERLRTLTGHKGGVTCVAWNPDGSKVATASWDKNGALWDAATGQRLRKLTGHTGDVTCVAWSPDGSKVATASDDNTIAVWKVDIPAGS